MICATMSSVSTEGIFYCVFLNKKSPANICAGDEGTYDSVEILKLYQNIIS